MHNVEVRYAKQFQAEALVQWGLFCSILESRAGGLLDI